MYIVKSEISAELRCIQCREWDYLLVSREVKYLGDRAPQQILLSTHTPMANKCLTSIITNIIGGRGGAKVDIIYTGINAAYSCIVMTTGVVDSGLV